MKFSGQYFIQDSIYIVYNLKNWMRANANANSVWHEKLMVAN